MPRKPLTDLRRDHSLSLRSQVTALANLTLEPHSGECGVWGKATRFLILIWTLIFEGAPLGACPLSRVNCESMGFLAPLVSDFSSVFAFAFGILSKLSTAKYVFIFVFKVYMAKFPLNSMNYIPQMCLFSG